MVYPAIATDGTGAAAPAAWSRGPCPSRRSPGASSPSARGSAAGPARSSSHRDRGWRCRRPRGRRPHLAGQRLAPAAQPRQHVLHLRERDLGLALAGLGVLGEDVEDQRGAVHHLDLDHVLQVDQLGRGQLPVADHRVGAGLGDDVAQLLGLAGADVGGRVGLVAALGHALEHLGTRGLGQRRELAQRGVGVRGRARGPHAHQDDPFQAQLTVFDLGDVLELGREPCHAAERGPIGSVELLAVVVVPHAIHLVLGIDFITGVGHLCLSQVVVLIRWSHGASARGTSFSPCDAESPAPRSRDGVCSGFVGVGVVALAFIGAPAGAWGWTPRPAG